MTPPPPARVPLIRATGTPFQAGYQHGAALAGRLRAFLGEDVARISRLAPAPVTLEELRPALSAYGAAIAAATPRLSEELDGLAAGAGISRDLAVLLQARRELIGYQRVPRPAARAPRQPGAPRAGTRQPAGPCGDCTAYASLTAGPGGGPVLAQTVDLAGDLEDQISVLDVTLQGAGRRALVLSFGGLLGYLGINSDGLAIGLNLVLGGDWHPGLPPYLAIRHLLDTCSCADGAVAELGRLLPLASSRSLTLCDTTAAVTAEILGDTMRLIEGTDLAHTNHFLHPDLAPADQLNIFARNSSQLRLAAAERWLAALSLRGAGRGAGAEDHFRALSQPPVCVAGTGDGRREKTVAAVVLVPGAGEMHLRPGNPSISSTQVFRLGSAA